MILDRDDGYAQLLDSLGTGDVGVGADVGIATLSPYVFNDFVESGAGSWVGNAPWAITQEWQPSWASPGNHSWSDSPSGNYGNNVSLSLFGGALDLSAVGPSQVVRLTFSYTSELESEQDYLRVEFSDNAGGTWYYYDDYVTGNWDDNVFNTDIPEAMLTSQFKFRFRLVTNGSVTYDGVHIDNIQISAYSTDTVGESDPRAGYFGTWNTGSLVAGPSSTYYYKESRTAGDLVQIDFTGPAILVQGRKGLDGGIASISLDGAVPHQADFYVDTLSQPYYDNYPAWVTAYYGLTDAPHTLTICSTGTKNPASSGYAISFEEAIIWGAGTTAAGVTHEEELNGFYEYDGPWASVVDPAASGGSLETLNARGCLSVAFEGDYLAWNAKKGPGCGKAKVSVDGGPLQMVDLYNAWDSSKKRVFNTGLLAGGPHTLAIYWSGEKNTSAWGTKIDVDSFDVIDHLVDADPAPPLAWRYQQSEPLITYVGDWTTSSTWSASGGSFASTSQPGAAAIVKFFGTKATVVARTTAWSGYAQIYVDGIFKEAVDLYSATTGWKAPVYSIDGLPPAEHTITVRCVGEANPSSLGTSIGLDAFDIADNLEQAPIPIRYHDSDSNLEYFPDWATVSGDWNYSNGDFSSLDEAGWVNVDFNGTYCAWYGRTTPWYGKAKVVLDGNYGDATIVDLYSASTKYKQRIYNTGLLDEGNHTLAVYWTGEKNPASTGTRVGVDSFDLFGTLYSAGDAPPIEWRYQQDNPKITYLGDWATGSTWSASGGSYISTSKDGAMAVARFTGTGVKVTGKKCPWYGQATITIDPGTPGVMVEVVDFYSSNWSQDWKQVVYTSPALSPGAHTIVIECDGAAIGLDTLDITGYLGQAPSPTRIDDNNAGHAAYSPAWSRWDGSGYWAAYMDTYAFTDQDDYQVTFTFEGTFVSWLSRTANTQGKAKVILDGNDAEAVVVDLYTPSTEWKKTVYCSGLLDYGVHTLVIECLYEKNPSSWWYSIGVDAFDVVEDTLAGP